MVRSYREAGVDIDEASRTVELIAQAAATTSTPAVLAGVGGFASLVRFDPSVYPDPLIVASTDSVGTKLKVAIGLGRHDTIGIDVVNHCLNDVAVTGADPLFFLDYLGVGSLQAEVAAQILSGVASACAAAGVPLVGGETAELPDLYAADDYDLAGFVVGAVARSDVIDGSTVKVGDAVLGLPSSGLHTNGYSLVRRVFPPGEWADTPAGLGHTLGEELLVPHRSYLDEIRILRRALRAAGGDIRALAHITGGGWVGNIARTLPQGLGVDIETGSWRVPLIFTLLQQRADIEDAEMVRTFNLGIGLTAVVAPELEDAARDALPELTRVGRVVPVTAAEERVRFI